MEIKQTIKYNKIDNNKTQHETSGKQSITPEVQIQIHNDPCCASSSHGRNGSNIEKNGTDDTKEDLNEDKTFLDEDDEDTDEEEELYGHQRNVDVSNGAPPCCYDGYLINGRSSTERKERHRRVLKEILDSFNLEDVKDKYRGATVIKNLSHADRRFRQWLESVMGNEEIDLCDLKWNERFRQKVMEEYERQQNLREKQLAAAETQRIQKLRLRGVLGDKDEHGMNHSTNTTRSNSKKHGKKKSTKSIDTRTVNHQTLYIRPNENIETQIQDLNKEPTHQKNVEFYTDTEDEQRDEQSKANDRSNGSSEDNNEDNTVRSNSGPNDRLPNKNNDDEDQQQMAGRGTSSGIFFSDGFDLESRMSYSYKSQLGRANVKCQEPHTELKRLYDEEDLNRLYAEAEGLVRIGIKK